MSWVILYENQKYDKYMMIRERSFRNRILNMNLNEVLDKKYSGSG